ncbi:MAG: hypothetical protein ABDI19_01525 [Armatimonadota bacterium]
MQRTVAIVGLTATLLSAQPQQPIAFFGAHLHSQIRTDNRTTQLRWYDDLAHHSVVYLQLYHESGYGAYIAQRLQNIPHDRTRTALDEVYLEREQGWRVGRFYAPFGAGLLLRESVMAVQSPARFAIGDLPMRVAYLFNSKERQQGFYVRVSTANGGISVGVGRHFGTDPHAFAAWALPEAPRHPEGYQQLYGADITRELGRHRFQLEWIHSCGNRIVDTHWFALRWQPLEMALQPELLLTYQTASQQLSWRLALHQRLDQYFSLNLVVRGRQGTLQFVGIGLRGEL